MMTEKNTIYSPLKICNCQNTNQNLVLCQEGHSTCFCLCPFWGLHLDPEDPPPFLPWSTCMAPAAGRPCSARQPGSAGRRQRGAPAVSHPASFLLVMGQHLPFSKVCSHSSSWIWRFKYLSSWGTEVWRGMPLKVLCWFQSGSCELFFWI